MNSFAIVIALGVLLVIAVVVIGYLVWRLNNVESRRAADDGRRSNRDLRSGSERPADVRDAGGSGGRDERTKFNWLLGRTGSVEGMRFHIGDQTVSIGRDVQNYIQVSNDAASKRHVVLVGDAAGLTLIDVDSSNGTILNGDEIDSNTEYQLTDGDEIKIADAVFWYRREGRYDDDSQAHVKEISLQHKTAALSAVGADGTANPPEADADLKRRVLTALTEHNGDYQAVADELNLDVSIVQRIIQNATSGR